MMTMASNRTLTADEARTMFAAIGEAATNRAHATRARGYHAYIRGWMHGAHARLQEQAATFNAVTGAYYVQGYGDGTDARREAAEYATMLTGHRPARVDMEGDD